MAESHSTSHRAGIYVRLSQDRNGDGLGVERQEAACRALAERKGWDVVDVYSDNDVSATNGKRRPEYERMWSDVREGVIDAVAVWKADRLTRTPAEFEHIIDTAERHGTALATVEGDLDLSTPTGRMVARMLGAAARAEIETKVARQKAANEQAAANGRAWSGGTRGYGYTRQMEVVPDEAAVIREAVARLLTGETLSAICADLQQRGVTTPSGKHWQPRTLRRLLASARISGRRERFPKATTRPLLGDIVAEGQWEPIISTEDSDRVRMLLDSSERRAKYGAKGRTYLLSGILVCSHCGHGMVGRPKSGTPRYACPSMPGTTACGKTYAVAARTDATIRDRVLVALEGDGLAKILSATDGSAAALADIRDLQRETEDLDAAVAAGDISVKSSATIRRGIAKRMEAAQRTLAKSTGSAALDGLQDLSYTDLLERWETMPLARRRAVVSAVVESITVNPADLSKRWDADRFDIHWAA